MGRNKGSRKGNAETRSKLPTVQSIRQALSRNLAEAACQMATELHAARPSDTHRRLLGETLDAALEARLKRPRDGRESDLLELARQIAEQNSRLAQNLVRYRLLLGQPLETGADSISEAELIVMGDKAVRFPEMIAQLPDSIRDDVFRVRRALEAVERADEQTTADSIAAIGFRSLFAPWRLFIKGLTAYYKNDSKAAIDAWRRLPPDRPPRQIARMLLAARDQELEPGEQPPIRPIKLREFKRSMARGNDDASSILESWKQRDFAAVNRFFARRWHLLNPEQQFDLRVRMWRRLASDGDPTALNEFYRYASPPAWDPRGLLAATIRAWRDPQNNDRGGRRAAEKYLELLPRLTDLRHSDHQAIRHVVCEAVADELLEVADDDPRPGQFFFPFPHRRPRRGANTVELRKSALFWYARAVQACPTEESIVKKAARVARGLPDDLQYAEILAARVDACPDQVTALRDWSRYLIDHARFSEADQPQRELERLVPRDEEVRELARRLREGQILEAALARDFPRAYQLCDEFESFLTADLFLADLSRCAIAYRARDPVAAEAFLEAARKKGGIPASVAMLMEVNSARFKLAPKIKREFRQTREREMAGAASLSLAAQLLRSVGPLLLAGVEYTGATMHRRALLDYLNLALRQAGPLHCTIVEWRDIGVWIFRLNLGYAEGLFGSRSRQMLPNLPITVFSTRHVYQSRARFEEAVVAIEQAVANNDPDQKLPSDLADELRRTLAETREHLQARRGGERFYAAEDDEDEYDEDEDFFYGDDEDEDEENVLGEFIRGLGGEEVRDPEPELLEAIRSLMDLPAEVLESAPPHVKMLHSLIEMLPPELLESLQSRIDSK